MLNCNADRRQGKLSTKVQKNPIEVSRHQFNALIASTILVSALNVVLTLSDDYVLNV